jgi:DNA-binding transcriptional ArsR family regulator
MLQVRALSHPLRLKLLELFFERPRTTMQAAEQLGEAPTRLYHHVASLERAGLVRLRETRPNRGTTEKYFEAVTTRIEPGELKDALRNKGNRRDLAAMGFLVFDHARNELVRALASDPGDAPEALMVVRGVLRISPTAAKRLRKELLGVVKRFARRQRRSGAASRRARGRYSLTIALLPTDQGSDKS